jgi:hypothetical protein
VRRDYFRVNGSASWNVVRTRFSSGEVLVLEMKKNCFISRFGKK